MDIWEELHTKAKKENDILEMTLAVAENGYEEAYKFLLDAYEKNPENYGPQTFYFLACLAGGADMPEEALGWLRKAIADHGWWYRPEVLEDDDLKVLKENSEFVSLKAMSDIRYADAAAKSEAVFSWKGKAADKLFLAVHGNTQSGETAREDWEPVLAGKRQWQMETIQSEEPDGYGTYRWSYDMASYLPVAKALEVVQNEGYEETVCGGFSAGCDMLLRAVTFSSVSCERLFLQSPWIPVLEDHMEEVLQSIQKKKIVLRIFCGSDDEDCLPLAKQLYDAANQKGLDVELTIQEHSRHQFPLELDTLKNLW